MKQKLRGFTLIELLVVVIIIAVLSAVALPMYKHAALKSRFSKVMPVAKSIVEAQEVYYLGKNIYAANDEKDLLDVSPSGDTTIELATREQENRYNYVAASRADVPGVRYIMYQKHSPKFANTIQCEADENNADALWLCEKGLGGTEIPGSINTAAGSYKTFLLAGTASSADKLPTSIYKVKAQICANVSEENCLVDEENNTITTQECNGSFYENWLGGSVGSRSCIKRTYDDTANQTDYVRENKSCTYDRRNGVTSCYVYKYNETGTQAPGYTVSSCNRTRGGNFADNGECIFGNTSSIGDPSYTSSAYYQVSEYDSNNTINQTFYFCTEIAANHECATVVTTNQTL